MPRYRLSSEAQNDIRAIRDYYVETAGARVARHVVTEIDRACRFLAEVPGAEHRREDLTNAPVRFWQVFSFFVIYDPQMRPLGVARILHTARDLETLLREMPPR